MNYLVILIFLFNFGSIKIADALTPDELINSKNKIEFHLSLCGQSKDKLLKKLFGHTLVSFEARSIFYFDTLKLDYYNLGIIFRARLKGSDKADFTSKLRPFFKNDILSKWQNDDRIRCEKDRYLNAQKKSCRLKENLSFIQLTNAIDNQNISKLITSDQVNFVKDHKNISINLEKIKIFGPVSVEKYILNFQENKWILEIWQIGNQSLFEFSFKSPKSEIQQNIKSMFYFLKEKKIRYCQKTISKTKSSLNYFLN